MYEVTLTYPEAQDHIQELAAKLDFNNPTEFYALIRDISIISSGLKQGLEQLVKGN